jgi:hypothetical protein
MKCGISAVSAISNIAATRLAQRCGQSCTIKITLLAGTFADGRQFYRFCFPARDGGKEIQVLPGERRDKRIARP